MVDLISLERGLVPPVPVLYCVNAERRPYTVLSDRRHETVTADVYKTYCFEKNQLGTSKETAREIAFGRYPYSDSLEPGRMKADVGIELMPYDPTQRSGWLWTYAALLVHKGTDDQANARNKGAFDGEMVDCICRMMAHRPGDRIDIGELKDIAKQNLEYEDDEPVDPYIDSGAPTCRDEDMYTDDYVDSLRGLLHRGIPVYNYG